MPEGRHVHHVRIGGMDSYPADVSRRSESDIAPRIPTIIRAVDTVAVRDVAANAGFTCAGVHDIGIGIRYRYCPDRGGVEVAVGDIPPVRAAIGRFEDAARARAEIERARVRRMASDRDTPSAAMRTNISKLQRPDMA